MGKNRLALHSVTLLVMALFAFLAMSCATKGFVWDETVPPEQSATIWFLYYETKTYNGIEVNTKKFNFVTLPAGEATFSGDIAWSSTSYGGPTGNTRYSSSYRLPDVDFTYNLEGGKRYTIVAHTENDIWGIGIYRDLATFSGNKPPKERLIQFIPARGYGK